MESKYSRGASGGSKYNGDEEDRYNRGSKVVAPSSSSTEIHAADVKSSSRGAAGMMSPKKETPSSSQSKYTEADNRFDFAEEKSRLIEIQQDIEADEEFERLKNAPTVSVPAVARSKFAHNFVEGFKIISMSMRDATTGRLVWRSAHWDDQMFEKEISEDIPKEILRCRVVSREIIFTSAEEMNNFRLEQRVYFKGVCIEEWFFTFGYVMSGSRNSWQQTIDAAPPNEMLPADVLSGQVVFETSFYDDKEFLCKNSVRIFYV